MSGLPREVFKWMQSLDLSYSVRHVKRDFCNGFLVAEIFNRYYKADIAMHSFDNGASMKRRKDNWEMLQRFFLKRSIPVSQAEIDAVIHCQPHAASELVVRVYNMLTGHEARYEPPAEVEEYRPAFARPTASLRIKQTLKEPSAAETDDRRAERQTAERAVEAHEQTLRVERTEERDRYTPAVHSATPIARGPSRKVAAASPAGGGPHAAEGGATPPVVFAKEITVRQVDAGVEQRMLERSQTAAAASAAESADESGEPPAEDTADASAGGAVSATALENAAARHLGATPEEMDEARGVAAFLAARTADPTADAELAAVFNEVSARAAAAVAAASLRNPQEFYALAAACTGALVRAGHGSKAFRAAASLLEGVGERMLERDPAAAWDLFHDLALPRLCSCLAAQPAKRPIVIRLTGTLCAGAGAADGGLRAVAALEEGLAGGDPAALLDCLALLARGDASLSGGSAAVADGYVSRAVAALAAGGGEASQAAVVRGLEILRHVASRGGEAGALRVAAEMDTLVAAAAPAAASAEALGQLCGAAAAALAYLPEGGGQAAELEELLQSVLREGQRPDVLRFGMAACATAVGAHAGLRRWYVDRLLRSDDLRAWLVGEAKEEKSSPAADGLVPVQGHWNAALVAEAVAGQVSAERPDNLGPGHVDLVAAALSSVDTLAPADAPVWRAVFRGLRDYLLVELCDEELCDAVVFVLRRFLYDPSTQDEAQGVLEAAEDRAPPLFGVLKLVYGPAGKERSQAAVHKLLHDLVARHPDRYGAMVYNLVRNFAANQADKFGKSAHLQDLMARLEGQGDDGEGQGEAVQ